MANIQTFLDKIKSAIYGKDVRNSIHDAIKAINEEVATNTSVVNGNDSQVKTNTQNIETNRKNIATNASNISENKNNHDELKADYLENIYELFKTKAAALVKKYFGKNIVAQDSSYNPFLGMKLYGKTTQVTTTGKNLLENTATSQTVNGVTFTVNDDGSVTANGTATENAVFRINTPTLTIGESYTLNGAPSGSSATTYFMQLGNFGNDVGQGVTNTFTESTGNSIAILVMSGVTVSNLVFKPMIRLASITDPTYEPYTGGLPSPSPQYSQPLESKGKWGNLFDKNNILKMGRYDSSGAWHDSEVWNYYEFTPTEDKYTLSGVNHNTDVYVVGFDNNNNITVINAINNTTYTVSGYVKVGLSIETDYLETAMLNYGTTALPYRPYSGQKEIESGVYGKNLIDFSKVTLATASNAVIDYEKGSVTQSSADTSTSPSFKITAYNGSENLFTYFYNNFTLGVNSISFTTDEEFTRLLIGINGSTVDTTIIYKFPFAIKGGSYTLQAYFDNITQGSISFRDIQFEKGLVATPFVKGAELQSHISLVGDGLKGNPLGATIPDEIKNSTIHMNGVYWNEEKQKYYISDTKENGNGEDVQRIYEVEFDGSDDEAWSISAIQPIEGQTRFDLAYNANLVPKAGWIEVLCTHWKSTNEPNSISETCWCNYEHTVNFDFRILTSKFSTVDELRAYLQEKPMKVQYILETPIETPLTADEIASFKALHSNYKVTSVMNDCECEMEVEINTDPKIYIDNLEKKHDQEIQTLKDAITALGGTV